MAAGGTDAYEVTDVDTGADEMTDGGGTQGEGSFAGIKMEGVEAGQAPHVVRRGGWMTKRQRLAAAVIQDDWDEASRLAAEYHTSFKP